MDSIVILTPHAPRAGVYRNASGDLRAFGVPGIEVENETDDELVAAVDLPAIDRAADHGVVVPLLLRDWGVPVVAIGVADGQRLALDIERRIGVLASANLSAGLSARAPLTEISGARECEERFIASLTREIGSESVDLPGTCAAGVLTCFGEMFAGRRARVLAHEAPVGVGYLVAEVV
ncbi:MAG: hypothetical protein KY391_01750 [Actinobacteria bacterium]|nr:hypothetical protein [Actinomycetota bacterium]